MSEIALTQSQRTNIATLRDIQNLSNRTQERLTSGREVNRVIDDAVSYFMAKGLNNRADDFMLRKDEIDQGISSLEATLEAVDAVDDYLKQMKAIAEAARSMTETERVSATEQFNELGTQISNLVEDASYRGFNLLSETNNQLDVRFSDKTGSRITVGGFDFNSTTAKVGADRQLFSNVAFDREANGVDYKFLGLSTINTVVGDEVTGDISASFTNIGVNNSQLSVVDSVVRQLDDAISRVRATSAELGSNVSILTTRLDFTTSYTDIHYTGADKLTLADMNEEGANLTALQTRQELGIQALSISGDQQRSVLSLLQ